MDLLLGCFSSRVARLPYLTAKTLDEVMKKRSKEAIEACLEVEGLKSKGHTELVGVQFVEVQA